MHYPLIIIGTGSAGLPAGMYASRYGIRNLIIGESNYIESEVTGPELVTWGPFRFTVNGYPIGKKVRIYFRPHDVYVSSQPETLQVPAVIEKTRFRGPLIELALNIGEGRRVLAHVPKGVALASDFVEGRSVHVGITAFHVFPAQS